MSNETMEFYIKSQPQVLDNIIENSDNIFKSFKLNLLDKVRVVYFLGSGTSFHAAQYGEWLFKHQLGYITKAMVPTMFNNYEIETLDQIYNKEELLIVGISQSGTSASTINALKSLKTMGIKTILFTEDLHSPACKYTENIIQVKCGKENIPPETKGYTSTLISLYLFYLKVGRYLKKISHKEYLDEILKLKKLPKILDESIKSSYLYFENNIGLFKNMKKISFIGYGIHFITCQEATLKLFETNHQPVNFYELEESIHGPQMAVDGDSYIFIIGSSGKEANSLQKYIDYYETLTSNVFVITNKEFKSNQPKLTISKDLNYLLSLINFAIPVQVISDVVSKANNKDTSVHPLGENRGFSHYR